MLTVAYLCDRTATEVDSDESIRQGERTMRNLTAVLCSVLFAGLVWAQASSVAEKKPATPEALSAEIEALKAAKVGWREIAWKTCLLEGLKESRATNKPVLLWIFIDRPVDDARC
jgi:hypothetical protein